MNSPALFEVKSYIDEYIWHAW